MPRTSGSERRLSGHRGYVGTVAFSADGSLLATGSWDRTIKLWDVEKKQAVLTLEGHRYAVTSVVFFPDNQTLASGAGESFELGEVKLWDVRTGLLSTLVEQCDFVSTVALSPLGDALAVSTGSGCGPREPIEPKVQLVEVGTGSVRLVLARKNCVAFAPDGRTIAAGGPDSLVTLYDARTGRQVGVLTGHQGNILAVAYSPNGRWLASGSNETEGRRLFGAVKLWDLTTNQVIRSIETGEQTVQFVAFSPDGRSVASGSKDGRLRLWQVQSGELVWEMRHSIPEFSGTHQFALSPDGSVLASGRADGAVGLWSVGSS